MVALDNDMRGWIMTVLSGVSCIFGACFIYVDLIVRLFPGKEHWRVQDSDGFLGCSLSLSAGVMMFSALYSMLPSAKRSLMEDGLSAKAASWILIACFLGGVFGIQFFSNIIHRFMPSHAVDCDHTHEEEDDNRRKSVDSHTPSHGHGHGHGHSHGHREQNEHKPRRADTEPTESTPLLASSSEAARHEMEERRTSEFQSKPSLQSRVSSKMANMISTQTKQVCDAEGQCYGFTDPCAHDCFKSVASRGGYRKSPVHKQRPQLVSSSTTPANLSEMTTDRLADGPETTALPLSPVETNHHASHDHEDHDLEAQSDATHHHHIPTNAFLDISVQTSIAIALHKLPEGFITYATNHANPRLGVSVFVAIAVHNITEGFALALPIFLASNSRLRAIILSIFLGGLSQPIGAGIAAVWLNIADRDRGADAGSGISDSVYGAMFAVTAGIMASVALSLFQQSFELSHSRGLCMFSAFIGMGVLGMSSALTA